MDDVLEIRQWAYPLPPGKGLETVWRPDQSDHPCQLDHLLFTELLERAYLALTLNSAFSRQRCELNSAVTGKLKGMRKGPGSIHQMVPFVKHTE